MDQMILLGLFIPFISFLLIVVFNQMFSRKSVSIVATTSIFLAFVLFLALFSAFYIYQIESKTVTFFQWINLKSLQADFSLKLDHLSMVMSLIITGIGFLIHLYSVGYMDHDENIIRYFAFLNFFIFAMLLLVLSNNLLLLFVGWEGVGLASYLLIGHYSKEESASKAATQAFVVNRIGDLGFVIALVFLFTLFGTTDIEKITQGVQTGFAIGDFKVTLLTLLLFLAATGKSAQIPLHVWLKSAMKGPTPVSALIHAATMVTAGVYLIVRLQDIFIKAPVTLEIIGIIGGLTSLYAALSAFAQTDLKKVLAYSTISQLGFMFLACGAKAFYSAMFHLSMHAFIKALLFLSCGNVIHVMQGVTEMPLMGGLAKKLPLTNWLFFIGVISLAGLPPFAAFFSKDLILEQESLSGHTTLFYLALLSSMLTAAYMMRAYLMTFRGHLSDENSSNPNIKEVGLIMLAPIIVLAFFSMTAGFVGVDFGLRPALEGYLQQIRLSTEEKHLMHGFFFTKESVMALFGSLIGISLAFLMFQITKEKKTSTIEFLKQAFYVDQIYEYLIVNPLKALSLFIGQVLEKDFFIDSMSVVATGLQDSAKVLEKVQNGQVRSYAAFIVLGASILMVYFIL